MRVLVKKQKAMRQDLIKLKPELQYLLTELLTVIIFNILILTH